MDGCKAVIYFCSTINPDNQDTYNFRDPRANDPTVLFEEEKSFTGLA